MAGLSNCRSQAVYTSIYLSLRAITTLHIRQVGIITDVGHLTAEIGQGGQTVPGRIVVECEDSFIQRVRVLRRDAQRLPVSLASMDDEQNDNSVLLLINPIDNSPISYPIAKVTGERFPGPIDIGMLAGVIPQVSETAIELAHQDRVSILVEVLASRVRNTSYIAADILKAHYLAPFCLPYSLAESLFEAWDAQEFLCSF